MSELTIEQRAIGTVSTYVDQLLTDEVVDELNAFEDKRSAFFAFVFGGIGGLALKEGLAPQDAQAVAIGVFHETLRLAPEDAMRMARLGIDAAAGDSRWSDAAQTGLEAFAAWQADPNTSSAAYLREALDRVPADGDPTR
jgi:hypothetical protein